MQFKPLNFSFFGVAFAFSFIPAGNHFLKVNPGKQTFRIFVTNKRQMPERITAKCRIELQPNAGKVLNNLL